MTDGLPLSSQERGSGGEVSHAPAQGEVKPEPWEVLDTEYLLRTPWRSVRSDRLRLHNGEETRYDYFETSDAAFVVPLTTDGQIVLMRQYRHPVRAWTWEIVGGGVGPEGPEASAPSRSNSPRPWEPRFSPLQDQRKSSICAAVWAQTR